MLPSRAATRPPHSPSASSQLPRDLLATTTRQLRRWRLTLVDLSPVRGLNCLTIPNRLPRRLPTPLDHHLPASTPRPLPQHSLFLRFTVYSTNVLCRRP